MKNQFVLSFGYLYIVILGILKESFFYSQVGIDYFKYSTIADILISPISDIASSVTTLCLFIFSIILVILLPAWLVKIRHKTWVKKAFNLPEGMDLDGARTQLSRLCIVMFCFGLMGYYVGRGIGSGSKISRNMAEKSLTFEDQITFLNGQRDTVFLIGKNTSFLFYLPKGKQEIEITPINGGGVKSIIEKR